MLLTVADGAEDLVSAPRHGKACLARVRLGHRHVGGRRRAFARPPRRGAEQPARRVDIAHEIGACVPDRLMPADRTPALPPPPRLLIAQIAHPLRGTYPLRRTRQPPR